MTKKMFLTFGVLLIVFSMFTGISSAASATLTIGNQADIGGYLADSEGKTLYYFTKDAPGISECKGMCTVNWPTFYTESIVVSPGLEAGDFGTMIRGDGSKQTTFRGWPLYYFVKDQVPGDMKGNKVNNVWFYIPIN